MSKARAEALCMDDFEQILLAIAGVGPARMRSLFEAGFDSAEKLGSANDEELSQVTGISRKLAQRIHDSFAPADPSQKKEPETNLFLCPSCGAFISLGAEKCEICGIEFEEEEDELAEEQVEVGEDEEAQRLSEELEADARDVENGQAEGDEDGFWYKKREKDLFLCPNCGAFIAEGEPKCHICGVEFSEEEESIEDVEQAMEDEADQVRRAQEEQALREEGVDGFWYKEKQKGLFLCPDCGAFISEGVTHCEICGIEFETETEEEAEVLELPIEKEGLAE
ncbi:MAG: helix-hairpin-helix domain-containing protein, partial [Candidatus Thermoplasmatota archaeon]|nr:helix-hairpin-helix domain-containing protein [Candidatus Thermoplasmatota archaeon]